VGLKTKAIDPADYAALATVLAENNMLADDIGDGDKYFFAFEDETGWRVGVGGLEFHGTAALLRSLLTMSCHRGMGLGGQMVEELIAHARRAGAQDVYLFTRDADAFFAKHGFSPLERDAAPEAIKSSQQFIEHCIGAHFMHRHIG
jgi:amino-acid N-acetyltransferase